MFLTSKPKFFLMFLKELVISSTHWKPRQTCSGLPALANAVGAAMGAHGCKEGGRMRPAPAFPGVPATHSSPQLLGRPS